MTALESELPVDDDVETPKRDHQRPRINSVQQLHDSGFIQASSLDAVEQVASRFSVAVTPQMLDLIDPQNPNDPVGRQFLPDPRELECTHEERGDPIGDNRHSPVTGIVHRYPDRVLLMPIRICPVYCRFCFRRETVGADSGGRLSPAEMGAAIDYIQAHDEIWEVILSGGDPLLLSPGRLQKILEDLSSIEHVRVVRIHSRVPVVSPNRISGTMLRALRNRLPVFVVLHCNHPSEFTDSAVDACARLVDAGVPMLSQSVLLRGINDDLATLTRLLRLFTENRIKPYYLHHADLAMGTGHFRTSIAAGRELMAQLRGHVSGICQPTYVLDIPGGAGKSPIGPVYLEERDDGGYTVTDYLGEQHMYKHRMPDTRY